ncbi:MAG: polyphosphate kinase 2 family protein [Chloroflexota bacterium]|nr:polyphosphate kinase 2 family protein [Chloroflexota bacterium]
MKSDTVDRYRVKPGTKVNLDEWDPNDKALFEGKKLEGKAALPTLTDQLRELQEVLYAEHRHKLLIVLQAMDSGGKDGTIRHAFTGVNPQGVRVASFKVPTAEEMAHDYLWRIHKETPGSGEIVIFNRSHYEDVLVVRVHELAPKKVWMKRYDHINAFEKTLADEGTTILKFYLNISPDEQKERLQARLDEPNKNWKFNVGDLAERKLWPEYMKAYEDVFSKTSTRQAPWYIVPGNRKWYRNLVISKVIIDTLEGLDMAYPEPEEDLDKVVIE